MTLTTLMILMTPISQLHETLHLLPLSGVYLLPTTHTNRLSTCCTAYRPQTPLPSSGSSRAPPHSSDPAHTTIPIVANKASITIKYQERTMKVTWCIPTKREDIELTICRMFGIPDSSFILLSQQDDENFVVSDSLIPGTYTLCVFD